MFLNLLKSVFYIVLILFMGTFVLSFLSGVVAFFIDILRFRLPHDKKWITIEKEKKKWLLRLRLRVTRIAVRQHCLTL